VTATVPHRGFGRTAFGAEELIPFLKTANQAAATSTYLAASPQVEG